MAKKNVLIHSLLKRRILVLDGAMGTELQKAGMPAGVSPELWCLENPAVLEEIHRAYLHAGADIIYTATFGANREKLEEYRGGNVTRINRDLAGIARRAAGSRALVAGDIGPTGKLVEPFGPLGFEHAVSVFREQAKGLLAGGVDLFVIETMVDIQEARAALIAVKELTRAFTIVTMTFDSHGRTLTGTDPVSALITLQSLGADAVGCNCSLGPVEMLPLIKQMKEYATVPLVAKPNAGIPVLIGEKTVFRMTPGRFASLAGKFAAAGVNMMGGCCGTTLGHIVGLKRALSGVKPAMPSRSSLSAVSSARGAVLFGNNRPLRIVGERINPTGKKTLQAELSRGNTGMVRRMAREQEAGGAHLLDVNVGMPGIDEKETMKKVVLDLSVATALPLVIDSPNPETIEGALRLYPGRALVNSLSGEKKKMKSILSAALRYGAMCILLPLDDRGVPGSAVERIAIIEKVFRKARAQGMTKDDILVDGLVMTVSSDPQAPAQTLAAIEWCARTFGCGTILGLSNVSFGMPERKWINAAFLAMASARGLTCAIANPGAEEMMHVRAACDLLRGCDPGAASYLARFASSGPTTGLPAARGEESPEGALFRAVIEGAAEDIEAVLTRALRSGMKAARLVQDIMIPAITKTGELYEKKEYFLPQLIAGAETMKKGMACLEPHLRKERVGVKKKGVVLIATVQGDIHDIGKNIVAMMLENHGFEVIDLGKDVSADIIVERAKAKKPQVIGLSALMTTTMVHMKDVVARARAEKISCQFLVGGAVVNASFARSIGAHYAKDGVEAVRVVETLIRRR